MSHRNVIRYFLPCVAAAASQSTLSDLKDMNDGKRRRPRVLLGITGSVAAVKGPELAVRLKRELDVDVRVLLTGGGFNFWNKAREYDPLYWGELEKHISSDTEFPLDGKIVIHSECAHCWLACY